MPYATPPGERIAYDLDGTQALIMDLRPQVGGFPLDVANAALAAMNDERQGALQVFASSNNQVLENLWYNPYQAPERFFLAFLSPALTRLRGIFIQVSANAGGALYDVPVNILGSTDTTNGVDGTWKTIRTNVSMHQEAPGLAWTPSDPGRPPYVSANSSPGVGYNGGNMSGNLIYITNDWFRRAENDHGIKSLSGSTTRNLRGLRIQPVSNPSSLSVIGFKVHLYGEPDTGAFEDRLDFWRPDADLPIPGGWLDWGDVPVGSTGQKSFRLKNASAMSTAQNVNLDAIAGNATVPPGQTPIQEQLLFSLDGTTWSSDLDFGALSPGAISEEIFVRRTTPLDSSMGAWAVRLVAEVGEWIEV